MTDKPPVAPLSPGPPAAAPAPPNGKPAIPGKPVPTTAPREIGGTKGPEPTRYGDWEVNGRCSDF